MIAKHIDKTNEFNAGTGNTPGVLTIDTSGWDYTIIHFVGTTGNTSFAGSNDGGAVQADAEGNPVSATNFVSVQGINQTTGAAGTTAAAGTIYKFSSVARYLQLTGTVNTSAKILVYFAKISQTM